MAQKNERVYEVITEICRVLLAKQKTQAPNTNLELECRFSTSQQKGCSIEFFQTAQKRVKKYLEGWTNLRTKSTVDIFYSHATRTIRTTIEYDSDTLSMNQSHVVKKRICEAELRQGDTRVKVALNSETMLRQRDVPVIVDPTYCRIKKRESYVYTPRKSDNPVWRFDFTKTYEGETMAGAEQKCQHDIDTHYEIEIELLDNSYLTSVGIEYTARSLMCKVFDFLNPKHKLVVTKFAVY